VLQILVDFLGRILCVPKRNFNTLVDSEGKLETDAHQHIHEDWKIMAQALDRLFFLLYVILTIILTLAFFVKKIHMAVIGQEDQSAAIRRIISGQD
jgi:flagellar biogenesis protein FliO